MSSLPSNSLPAISSSSLTHDSLETPSSSANFIAKQEPVIKITKRDGERIEIKLETPRLVIRSLRYEPDDVSVLQGEIHHYKQIFQHQKTMQNYIDGQTFTDDDIIETVTMWATRFFNGDPFSTYAVFLKPTEKNDSASESGEDNLQFIGSVNIGHDEQERAGHSELAYIFHSDYWNKDHSQEAGATKGYKYLGVEAVAAVVNHLAPRLNSEGFKVHGEKLSSLHAWANETNNGSQKILKRLGMEKIGPEARYGITMQHFAKALNPNPSQ